MGVLTILRFFFALFFALVLLFTLSYPDLIVPSSPHLDGQEALSLYKLRSLLWLFPLLAMELVAIAGPRRNLVWFTALFGALFLGFLAYPLLAVFYPEWVSPTLFYQGGMLGWGLLMLLIMTMASVAFRLAFLSYFFTTPLEDYDANEVELSDLAPATGRTVADIAANPVCSQPRFLFGSADMALVTRFYVAARVLIVRRRTFSLALGLCLLVCVAFFLLFPRVATPAFERERDLARMYDVSGEPGAQARYLSSYSGLHAAYRVFKDVARYDRLAGMSDAQAERSLGLERLPLGLRSQLREADGRSLAASEDAVTGREPFVTLTDGRRKLILFVHRNLDGSKINISELYDEGWDASEDRRRKRLSADWRSHVLSR